MGKKVAYQLLPGTDGAVVGLKTKPEYSAVTLHGWILNNGDADAGHVLSFYTAEGATLGNNQQNLPSADGIHLFDIATGEGANTVFWDHADIFFKDGLFIVCDDDSLTGVVLWS